MNIFSLCASTIILVLLPALACGQVSIQSVSTTQLASSHTERATYTVRTTQPGQLSLHILSPDGDLVRTLGSPQTKPPGQYILSWDGTDLQGKPIPDEAYCARAILKTKTAQHTDAPCEKSGGEVLEGLNPSSAPSGDISYTLEKPARVMVRVGVKNGAMMRSLSVWRPRPAGRNLQRWSGFDEGGQIDLRTNRLALLVTAFALPNFSVITTGQTALDYRTWRKAKGWSEAPDTPITNNQLERSGKRIARQHHMARFKDSEPRIALTLTGTDGQPAGNTITDQVRISVDLYPEDRWLMQEQLYEVGFFVDGDFVSEEENGYVPIGWIWNTSSLKPGKHLLTVNLTGFTGRVGTQTIAVTKL
jgi:hypothetical protein